MSSLTFPVAHKLADLKTKKNPIRRLSLGPLTLNSPEVADAKLHLGNKAVDCVTFGALTLCNVTLLTVSFTSPDSTNLLGDKVEGTLHITYEEI